MSHCTSDIKLPFISPHPLGKRYHSGVTRRNLPSKNIYQGNADFIMVRIKHTANRFTVSDRENKSKDKLILKIPKSTSKIVKMIT